MESYLLVVPEPIIKVSAIAFFKDLVGKLQDNSRTKTLLYTMVTTQAHTHTRITNSHLVLLNIYAVNYCHYIIPISPW